MAFHYTSLESALKIIESRSLLLSNIRFCNDGAEFLYGESLLQALQDRPPSSTIESYPVAFWIACFTACEDSFAQWMLYGDQGNGVCIEFDLEKLQEAKDQIKLLKVEYDLARQKASLQQVITKFENGGTIKDAFEDFCRFKDAGFRFEEETRLVQMAAWENLYLPFVFFHAKSGRLIPRLALKFDRPLQVIKSIKLGPRANHALNPHSMRKLLERENIQCEVTCSKLRT